MKMTDRQEKARQADGADHAPVRATYISRRCAKCNRPIITDHALGMVHGRDEEGAGE